jgi:hypothetical protein
MGSVGSVDGAAMPLPLTNISRSLTVAQLQDLIVTVTVCLGIVLLLTTACAFALFYPDKAASMFGEFTVEKSTGFGGLQLGLFLVLKHVYKTREPAKNAT